MDRILDRDGKPVAHIFEHMVQVNDVLNTFPRHTLKHIEAILDYLWDDEMKDYQANNQGDTEWSDDDTIDAARKLFE